MSTPNDERLLGSVSISINGTPLEEFRYTPNETVPVRVTVEDPERVRWGFQVTARDQETGCMTAGRFDVPPRDDPSEPPEVQTPEDIQEAAGTDCEGIPAQYATHTFPKEGGTGATFEVLWTAPGEDSGTVIFAAAGNAANGNGLNDSGDHIYTTSGEVQAAQPVPMPTISQGGVVTANLVPTIQSISPNAIISVFGTNFVPEGVARSSGGRDLVDNKVPTNFEDVCVEIGGERAPIFFVSELQLNVQAPTLAEDVLGDGVPVEAIAGCGTPEENRSQMRSVTVAPATPGFFVKTFDGPDGANPIAALHEDGQREVREDSPAAPGEFVSLFATGFGPTEPPLEAGEIPQLALDEGVLAEVTGEVTVEIGGVALSGNDIFFVGAAPCCAGLYQLVVPVPEGVEGNVPVIATVDGVSTPEGPFITVEAP